MSENAGYLGAIYKAKATLVGIGIAFVDSDPDTITDTGSGFVDAGFENGDYVTVAGSTDNDGTYLIGTVAAGTLTLDAGETLTAEAAGDQVTLAVAARSEELAGFYGWSVDRGLQLLDITDFGDSGVRKYLANQADWTGRAQKHWLTDDYQESLLGTEFVIRFFIKDVAVPSGGNKALYLEGLCRLQGLNTSTDVGALIEQELTFQGNGALSEIARSSAWDA